MENIGGTPGKPSNRFPEDVICCSILVAHCNWPDGDRLSGNELEFQMARDGEMEHTLYPLDLQIEWAWNNGACPLELAMP
jgi:hypothetical protein